MRKSSPLLVSPAMMTGLTVVIAIILLASNFTIINAQQQQEFTTQPGEVENRRAAAGTATTAGGRTFQSTNDSFSVQVPDGWIIQDVDNAGPAQLEEVRQGYGILVQLCPEEQQGAAAAASNASSSSTNTISSINASRCQGAQEVIHVIRYPDLDTRLSANNITTTNNNLTTTIDNILTYHLQKLQEVGYRSMQIVNSTDMTSNLRDPQTNQTIQTVPGKLVEMTYSTNFAPNEIKRGYFILTATNSTVPNLGTTKGYSIFYEGNSTTTTTPAEITTTAVSLPLPPPVGPVFDSFELIAAPEVAQALAEETAEAAETAEGVEDGAEDDGDDGDNGDTSCDPSYPDVCIPPPPPNLNCDDEGVPSNFEVSGSDPHGFDGDNDGIGCESPDDDDDDEDNGADDDDDDEDNGADDDDDDEDNGADDDDGDDGEGNEGGNNPNEFEDCIVPPGMDPGDVGC
jgi:hypothetical protein